jgi:hypothetical protein
MIDKMLPFHIEIIIFAAWIGSILALRKYLNYRYGAKKKIRYKRMLCELYFGVSLILFWKVLKEDWLTIGIPGVIATIHALGQLAYFTPKRPIHEKEDTTFR